MWKPSCVVPARLLPIGGAKIVGIVLWSLGAWGCEEPTGLTDGGARRDANIIRDDASTRDAQREDAFRPPVACENVLTPGEWVDITPDDPGIEAVPFYSEVGVHPDDPCTVYAVGAGFQRSTNGGGMWDVLARDALRIPQRIRIDPDDPDHMLTMQGVNDFGLFQSHDGGVTWTTIPGFEAIRPTIGGTDDIYALEVDPEDFGHFLVSFHSPWTCEGGCVGGVVECFDDGDRCVAHPVPEAVDNGGWNVFFLSDPARGVGNGNTWLYMTQPGGSGEGFWRTTDAGEHWTKVFDVPMIHGGSQLYYATTGRLYAALWNGIGRSDDNGETWERIPDAGFPQYTGYFGIGGDGEHLYLLASGGGYIITALETDDEHWTQDTRQMFEYGVTLWTFDARNRVMYGAFRQSGVHALKLAD